MRRSVFSAGVNFLTVGWLTEADDDAGTGALAVGAPVPMD
jgi:hypothetical protein